MNPDEPTDTLTFLFTDIEGSSRLWEEQPERMRLALARHDAILRTAVEARCGKVVKTTGDGLLAEFRDPRDALAAVVEFQRALAAPGSTGGLALRVRCGVHAGVVEHRDGDLFGTAMNRAARIMNAAHGGQALVSQAVAHLAGDRLPEGVSLRDIGVVRLRDLSRPEHVYQVAHADLRGEFPALRSLEATPNNLPVQVTSFVGRERERAELRGLLASTRLVTLLGAGGIGKTRLSLATAVDVMHDYPDGVWFVEFAALNDPRLVPQAVASALGVTEEAGRPVSEALVKYVKDRHLLIVLDNCEHLVGACAGLAKRLLEGPRVHLLATSREPLRLAGETTYPVPALTVPVARTAPAPSFVEQYEAVRLFVDRAVAAQPAFKVTPANAAALVEICRRLDGIPLALELAAARVRALPVQSIAARLHDCFRLLVGGDRTALPRQQTLRALIDWSYELLEPNERALLQRLSVFEGGFTIDAAEAVGAGGDLVAPDVPHVLTLLVEKSLVTLQPDGQRYRLLDTVQQYAQELLDAAGGGDEARSRHLAWCVTLAEQATANLFGPDQAAWLRRLDLERQNLLSAHAWCDRAGDGAALGLRLGSALKHYWLNRGLLTLGHQVAMEALARAGAQGRTVARCRGLLNAGQLCLFMGRYEDAQRLLSESLGIAREIDDAERVTAALQPLGTAFLGLGDYPSARAYLEEALALAHARGSKRSVAAGLNALGQLNRMEGRLETAERLYAQMLVLARELREPEATAIGLLNLAMVEVGRGARDRVRDLLLEVFEIVAETGSKPAGQSALEVSAGMAVMQSDYPRAARLYGVAEAQTLQTGFHRDPADEAFLIPLVAKARAALGPEMFAVEEKGGSALAYEDAIAEARAALDEQP